MEVLFNIRSDDEGIPVGISRRKDTIVNKTSPFRRIATQTTDSSLFVANVTLATLRSSRLESVVCVATINQLHSVNRPLSKLTLNFPEKTIYY